MNWTKASNWHLESDCKRYIVAKFMVNGKVDYQAVRKPDVVLCGGYGRRVQAGLCGGCSMRTLRQPTKDALREQLALAADEIIRLKSWQLCAAELIRELRGVRKPWWRRLWGECKAACEGDGDA